MKRWLVIILLALAPRVASAQGRFAYVPVEDSTRAKIAAFWRATYAEKPGAAEAIGCLRYRPTPFTNVQTGDSMLVALVTDFRMVPAVSADPVSSHWPPNACRIADEIPVHFHTPSTCAFDEKGTLQVGSCVFGGTMAYECLPSDPDLLFLASSPWVVNAVVCDEHAIVFYRDDPPDLVPVLRIPPTPRVQLTAPGGSTGPPLPADIVGRGAAPRKPA